MGNKELRVFQNSQFGQIRVTVDNNNEPWFVTKDVCEILDIKNSRDTLSKVLDEEEKRVENIYIPGGSQKMAVINESGLYHLVFVSHKPEAQIFRKWVTSEVLPSIRK